MKVISSFSKSNWSLKQLSGIIFIFLIFFKQYNYLFFQTHQLLICMVDLAQPYRLGLIQPTQLDHWPNLVTKLAAASICEI
jgi:hypothetical protein